MLATNRGAKRVHIFVHRLRFRDVQEYEDRDGVQAFVSQAVSSRRYGGVTIITCGIREASIVAIRRCLVMTLFPLVPNYGRCSRVIKDQAVTLVGMWE